jgi:hypothetical protein
VLQATRESESASGYPTFDAELVSSDELYRVPMGRSRFLRRVGTVVFGAAIAGAVRTSDAFACTTGAPPAPCGPSHACCCCNAYSGCCSSDCTARDSGCGANGDGWYVCVNGIQYFCADYWSGSDKCTCLISERRSC